ncbi:ethanolamine ammonia-lyase subunit EutC [Comamonas sp. J-3]|uniref:ethanolamine ammonia-lyase subunit EutC n=1 Tax=Comamonas trifloxystrobinivorans TaxID=3350256 RepID=UPI00372AAD5C
MASDLNDSTTAATTSAVTPNPWEKLRQFTAARIALGRAGTSMPTQPQLAFAQAHAQARVAVHREVDFDALERELQALGAVVRLHSAAHDRPTYLQRPDLGRRLSEDSQALLQQQAADSPDVVFVIADGLSSLAIERNAQAFLQRLLPAIEKDWRVGPLVLVKNARVAVGDEVGAALDAALVVVLVGERPGLSSPDSMGIYLTWSPRVGLTDESRNCISNVRLEGMSYAQAVHKLRYLMEQARERQLSGVRLKDESDALITSQEAPARAFLVSAPPP